MCKLFIDTNYSAVSPDSSSMLSPSDVSIDPVDGDAVSICACNIASCLITFVGYIIFAKWKEMEKSECGLILRIAKYRIALITLQRRTASVEGVIDEVSQGYTCIVCLMDKINIIRRMKLLLKLHQKGKNL